MRSTADEFTDLARPVHGKTLHFITIHMHVKQTEIPRLHCHVDRQDFCLSVTLDFVEPTIQ